tara:strand:+ start:10511 stop:11071 length:561 start_codon:yes stop_codon:yes gene_type:complete
MAEGQPEMIPMPGGMPPDSRGPMPESFEKKLSPEEEQNLLVNFMGSMYGETKKLDGNIVGESATLGRGRSEKIKQQIEQVISQPQQSVPQPVQTAPVPQPVVQQPQVQQVQQVVEQPQANDSQMTFSFDINEKDQLFDLIKTLSTRIDKLHRKVDDLLKSDKNSKVTSLPIKKSSKKKSVEPKRET